MKKTLFLLIAALTFGSDGCERQRHPFFKPLEPVYKKLSNGMELFVLEDREFPTVQLSLFIRGGSVYDPQGKEGLSTVAMQTIRLGGTEGRRPEEIEESLEFVGASLEMGTSPEYHSASLALLKKDLGLGLDLLFGLLRRPALDPSRFEIIKGKTKEAIRREKEDPLTLAYKEYPSFVYGEGSAWGRKATVKSIDRIGREDVKRFHREFIHPDRMIVAVAGDFGVDEIVSAIEERVGGWKPAGDGLSEIPRIEERFEKEVALIPREGLTQTTILIGHLGGKRDNPDKFPLLVMNFIFGGSGSLTSRLGEEIRSSAGKAYAVWSDFGFAKDYGLFRAVAQTELTNTDWVVQKIQAMIRDLAQNPDFTEEEIERAKLAILRSLIFDFETRFAQVREQAKFHLWGYPKNYLELFQREIAKVSKADLKRVAKQYLHPEGLKVLLVGDEKGVEKMGSVTKRSIE
jgi:predicted Zn-dependent peptidase